MKKSIVAPEAHRSDHMNWLRAAVLGANDGIVSTASLIIGVATAHVVHQNILITGFAGLVAGAMSMAAGEYVSVSSQADTENADLEREKEELSTNYEFELIELAEIYVGRGLDPDLAAQVSQQLMAFDALGSHARDELGITSEFSAKPIQAAFVSAAAFSIGAALPLSVVFVCPERFLIQFVAGFAILFLVVLGISAARVGGANLWRGALRVGFWGASAMSISALMGTFFGNVLN